MTPKTHMIASRDELHERWRNPSDFNVPTAYIAGAERSKFLVSLLKAHVKTTNPILELGCNVGRNLFYMQEAGFEKLSGVEINTKALELTRRAFPELVGKVSFTNTSIEEAIGSFGSDSFAAVVTMAVLEHLHPDSEWVFAEMVRITKDVLITVEDEATNSPRHVARDYGKVFTALGMQEVSLRTCGTVGGLGSAFVARVFRKC